MTRGTTNKNARGNSEDRRRRRAWLLNEFGDGETAPCAFCGISLNDETITVDRIIPGVLGGRYVRGNIRPACGTCNERDGATRCVALAKSKGKPGTEQAASYKVALLGPIAYWWTCWGSPEHLAYVAHRERLSEQLVDAGHLVYSPHKAWQGSWDEMAQAVNDAAIRVCDVVVNMRPPRVPSMGLDSEIVLCEKLGKPLLEVPPGSNLPGELLREVMIAS